MLNFFYLNSFLDHAFPGQFGFQYPASKIMDGIINLHHFLMFFIVIILFFVFTLIFLIFQHFTFNNELNFKDFLKLKDINNVNISHGSILEII
jgi:heme/copper-type cytochrome/quinol oxidase subunit 2